MLLLVACHAGTGGDARGDVVLNEVSAHNQSTWDDGSYTFPDWIELYNRGDSAVSLSDLSLSDGGDAEWQGGAGTLGPGERLFVPAGTPSGAPFSLSATGGEALVLRISGEMVDRLALDEVAPDLTWARLPDGGEWAATTWATPDQPNGDAPSPTLDPSDDVFQAERVLEIQVELDPTAEASLRVDRLTAVTGAVTLDGIRFAPVEVRLKSTAGSKREFDQKPGFKIDLGQFHWRGQEKLTLNNLVQDESYVHEHLAYRTYRAAGVPAPRVGWVHLSVSGEDYGLYLLVENPDAVFLSRWYTDPTGPLYEASYGVDVVPGAEPLFDYDEGPDPADHSGLTALIDAVATPPETGSSALAAILDEDELADALATSAVTLHWDGYANTNNYRLYQDPTTGRFQMLPWGADETFDRSTYNPWQGRGVMISRCMADLDCRARYESSLSAAAARAEALELGDEARRLAEWLRPYIIADPRREFDMATHDAVLENTVRLAETWPTQLAEQVQQRQE